MFEIIAAALALVLILFLILRRNRASPSSPPRAEEPAEEVREISLAKVEGSESKGEKAEGRKKKRKREEEGAVKSSKQLEEQYSPLFYGVLSLKASNSLSMVDSVCLKNSKILISSSKNELVLFDLKRWKKDSPCQDRYFTSLDNNQSSATAIGPKHYYTALNFEKTIAYYEFLGGDNGVYFREVRKFARNLYKSDLSSLYVPESERFIVGTGSGADTVMNVWSMGGEKLAQVNTYQIEHYSICYGANKALVRGWTSEVKMFQFVTDKGGEFVKVDKSHHLTHSEQAICSAIDNLGLYAVTVCKSDVVKLWAVYSPEGHLSEKTVDAYQLEIEKPHICAVHTLRDDSDRLRTFVVLANSSRAVLCDRELNIVQILEGLEIAGLHMTGTAKSAVLGTYSPAGKLTIWNISSLLERMKGYVLP